MEATCEYEVGRWLAGSTSSVVVCDAPIPRLDGADGEDCVVCGEQKWENVHRLTGWPDDHHQYLGPFASECTRGHPVAVPSEAERRQA